MIRHSKQEFKLSFNIYNKNSASGSITKPELVLKLHNGSKRTISPVTEEVNQLGYVVRDLGKTVFLVGGELKQIELEYSSGEFAAFEQIKESLDSLKFNISFTDNVGNSKELEINEVKQLKDIQETTSWLDEIFKGYINEGQGKEEEIRAAIDWSRRIGISQEEIRNLMQAQFGSSMELPISPYLYSGEKYVEYFNSRVKVLEKILQDCFSTSS